MLQTPRVVELAGRRGTPTMLLAATLALAHAATAAPPPPGPPEVRTNCGGNYGWFNATLYPTQGAACPTPTWEPVWELNLSTTPWTPWGPESAESARGFYNLSVAGRWGWLNFDWSDGSNFWQDALPQHDNEAVMVKQCSMIKELGTGTRCFVYRNTELALQWEETSRAAMTQANVDNNWFLKYKTKACCDAAVPCNVAAYNNANTLPLIPCNKTTPVNHSSLNGNNCGNCCNFSATGTGAYNEPIGGLMARMPPNPNGGTTRFGHNALGDGQLFWDFRTAAARGYTRNFNIQPTLFDRTSWSSNQVHTHLPTTI